MRRGQLAAGKHALAQGDVTKDEIDGSLKTKDGKIVSEARMISELLKEEEAARNKEKEAKTKNGRASTAKALVASDMEIVTVRLIMDSSE